LEKVSKVNMSVLSSSSTTPSTTVSPNSLLIGSHGDILDMITIPSATSAAVTGSGKMAVVTNSPQLRILTTSTMQCEVLEGHSDIILAVDVSSDG
jgi:U3 small nucleolar RNA-associated protein 13